ncbi:MAG: hypothetical protein ACI9MC_003817, partial [Kiritimatiellia bacterium]
MKELYAWKLILWFVARPLLCSPATGGIMYPTVRLALLTLVLCAPALAADADAPKTELDMSALYAVWGLTQANFKLGADHPLDDATYTVQMLRLNAKATRGDSGLLARADLAQGW